MLLQMYAIYTLATFVKRRTKLPMVKLSGYLTQDLCGAPRHLRCKSLDDSTLSRMYASRNMARWSTSIIQGFSIIASTEVQARLTRWFCALSLTMSNVSYQHTAASY